MSDDAQHEAPHVSSSHQSNFRHTHRPPTVSGCDATDGLTDAAHGGASNGSQEDEEEDREEVNQEKGQALKLAAPSHTRLQALAGGFALGDLPLGQ